MKSYRFGPSAYLFLTMAALALALRAAPADDLSGVGQPTSSVIFNSDFSQGTFDHLGWVDKGENWNITDFTEQKPGLKNSPGPSAYFGAYKGDDKQLLIHKFPAAMKPQDLTLTFDAGWAWGQKDQGADAFQVFILDDNGNGYDFEVHRTNAAWAAQWALVTAYKISNKEAWGTAAIDATQAAVLDGGGLQTFTIKRDSHGSWSLSGANWTGATPYEFVDVDRTTDTFSQVALVGGKNFDGLVFNKIKLEITPQQ
jgi:hypothetical protein